MNITIWDWAKFRGVDVDAPGGVSMGEFDRVGLPMMGGCYKCGACIAAGNACPTRHGFLACDSCVDEGDGYETADEANRDNFPEEYGWLGASTQAAEQEEV